MLEVVPLGSGTDRVAALRAAGWHVVVITADRDAWYLQATCVR